MKILIVDDSKAMRLIVKRILRQTDIGSHDTVEAENGQEGLKQVEAESPDLVISEIQRMHSLVFASLYNHRHDNK